ncbi:MAG: DoxX family membrane protein [Fidelibacterota bacterium]
MAKYKNQGTVSLKNTVKHLTTMQTTSLVLLRVIIGWHFTYEGLAKLFDAKWSAYFYLLDSQGWLRDIFINMANNPRLMLFIDPLIKWGLLLIGLSLMTGLLTKYAKLGALVMLLFFWLSHPPFIGYEYLLPSEGHYLVFDKNSVEFFAVLVLLMFPTEHIIGLQRMFNHYFRKAAVND